MKILALAAVLVLALPFTALAVTLKPPNPTTISVSGTGAPNCTALSFKTAKPNYRMRVKVYRGSNARRSWVAANVKPGLHTVTFCAASNDRPGTYTWVVATRHYEDSTRIVKKVGQPFTVEP